MTDKADSYLREYLSEVKNENVPAALLKRVKKFKLAAPSSLCPHCGKPITPFKKPLTSQRFWNAVWMLSAAAALGLSFVAPRYFVQWVALAVLFGVKFIIDQRATKTQILIYKALAEDSESFHRHQTPSRL